MPRCRECALFDARLIPRVRLHRVRVARLVVLGAAAPFRQGGRNSRDGRCGPLSLRTYSGDLIVSTIRASRTRPRKSPLVRRGVRSRPSRHRTSGWMPRCSWGRDPALHGTRLPLVWRGLWPYDVLRRRGHEVVLQPFTPVRGRSVPVLVSLLVHGCHSKRDMLMNPSQRRDATRRARQFRGGP